MKHTIYLALIVALITGCKKAEIPTYSGGEYVQLFENAQYDKIFSFVYSGTAERDTLYIDFKIVGPTKNYDRQVTLKQVREYGFEYFYDGDGIKTDSVLVEKGAQAVAGTHFIDFNSPDVQRLMVVKADSVRAKIGIILLRDPMLKKPEGDRRLNFQIVENEFFEVGDRKAYKGVVTITDRLSLPKSWNKTISNATFSADWGNYGPVKHQFMIDASTDGEKWDDEFFAVLNKDPGLMNIYRARFTKELARLNKELAERGQPPLREDPNNPASAVVFP